MSRLIVDLDGTLSLTDTLHESFAYLLFRRPLALLRALPSLLRGRAQLKRKLSALAERDWSSLPIRKDLLGYLKAQRASGRSVHLVTAADQSVADAVAAQTGVFDSAHGSDGERNLKGRNKLAFIRDRFDGPFAYAGDSRADLPVWREADGIILADASAGTERAARALGKDVEAVFASRSGGVRAWLKELRLHQWAKNALIFAPVFLSHSYGDVAVLGRVFLGFLVLGAVASATYILNDISDLDADRAHWKKRERPFASGALPIWQGLLCAPLAILLGLAAAYMLEPAFAGAVLLYLALTLSYSFGLKRVAFLDLMIIASLFTLRLGMGVALVGGGFTEWLLTFSMFLFFSLSAAKRHVEILKNVERGDDARLPGRGYQVGDQALTLALGIGSMLASVLILVLYLVEDAFPQGGYTDPGYLWSAPMIIALWLGRIWLLAHRGKMDHDPVAFAVSDRVSLALGAALAASFALASI